MSIVLIKEAPRKVSGAIRELHSHVCSPVQRSVFEEGCASEVIGAGEAGGGRGGGGRKIIDGLEIEIRQTSLSYYRMGFIE